MKNGTTTISGWVLLGVLGILLVGVSVSPTLAAGQKGNNAVFNTSSTCSPCTPSPAFIDASVFTSKATTFCGVLNYVLTPINGVVTSSGAVIDARGLNSGNTSMTCTASPWAGITNPPPTTILLPATTATAPIVIPTTWVLPPNTRIVGEGGTIGSGTVGTIIQAASGLTSGSMIQMVPTSTLCLRPGFSVCTGISVENVVLDGQGNAVNGIENQAAGDRSYVDNVSLFQIRGTGLQIDTGANGSGPYTNITFDLGIYGGASSTHCASINNAWTRGIHGLTCISSNNDPPAAVLLDGSNNSLEDVRIVGFYDGILVGANGDAKSNVLINVIGDTRLPFTVSSTPITVVHIPPSSFSVTDLSIVGLANIGGSGTYSLHDELTGALLSDASVGIYALGEQPSSGIGYSRFTTSPSLPTWGTGSASPTPLAGCTRGSIYSCTGGSSCKNGGTGPSYALWDCKASGSSTAWTPVI
jgi:hypothetical protein